MIFYNTELQDNCSQFW